MSDLHQLILKAKYSLKTDKVDLSDNVKNLIKSLLETDPKKRLNIQQVRDHPWLTDNPSEYEHLEIFSQEELDIIKKNFTYQDVRRFNRNQNKSLNSQEEINYFTEHELDSTQNALMRNNTTKSVILAPFNSTRSNVLADEEDKEKLKQEMYNILDITEGEIIDKKCIKFAPRAKDVDRQYELNNNGEVDNGVYNKFIRQSTQGVESQESAGKFEGPMVSKNSDDEVEEELLKQNQQTGELQQIHSYL